MNTPLRRHKPAAAVPAARLATGAALLHWLRDDGADQRRDDAQRTTQRFGAGDSAQHPLVRLGGAGLTQAGTGSALDAEALTNGWPGAAACPTCASTR